MASLALPNDTSVPGSIKSRIRAGWIAALIFGLLMGGSLAVSHQQSWFLWSSAFAPLILGYGIAKHSRASAFLMLIYFVVFEVLSVIQSGHIRGMVFILIFMVCFFLGCQGTVQFHKWKVYTSNPDKTKDMTKDKRQP